MNKRQQKKHNKNKPCPVFTPLFDTNAVDVAKKAKYLVSGNWLNGNDSNFFQVVRHDNIYR